LLLCGAALVLRLHMLGAAHPRMLMHSMWHAHTNVFVPLGTYEVLGPGHSSVLLHPSSSVSPLLIRCVCLLLAAASSWKPVLHAELQKHMTARAPRACTNCCLLQGIRNHTPPPQPGLPPEQRRAVEDMPGHTAMTSEC